MKRYLSRLRTDVLLNRAAVLRAMGISSIEEFVDASYAGAMKLMPLLESLPMSLPVLDVDTTDGWNPDLDAIVEFVIATTLNRPE